MNRILFEKAEIREGVCAFSDGRAEHVLDILHGEVGQVLKTGELDGLVGTSTIARIEGRQVTVTCTHDTAAPAPWVDLILAPPRPRALKRLLPQLATLGVGRIVLVGAEKVEKAFWGAQLLKEEIYRPLLVEGLMQGGTSAVPVITQAKSFTRYLARTFDSDFAAAPVRLVAHPYGSSACSPDFGGTRPVVAVGPEGGWTDQEVALLEAKGFARYSLGPRILRTDTALVALLARLMPIGA